MRLEIITVGDELLLGFTVDTNAAHLARALAGIGVEIVRRTTVGDDAASIRDAVASALDRTGAVITTGGLGPTSDDLTKPAIAELFGRGLHLDDEVLAAIEARFARFGSRGPMPPGNRQQALVPDGARVLPNCHGTAPGIWIEDDRGRWVAMLPGVPHEMRAMTADTMIPLLAERVGSNAPAVRSRTIRTTGIGESALAELLGTESRLVEDLTVAYLPGWEGTDLRLTVRDRPGDGADALLDRAAARLRARAGLFVYGEDEATLSAAVVARCRALGLRLAVAESCTGGLLGAMVTSVPGASEVFAGGIIAYEDGVKESQLGVAGPLLREHGAVSGPVALAMAAGARKRVGGDIGVGITGIAGPGGGSAEKPVGTVWIAVDIEGLEPAANVRHFLGDREDVRRRACQSALDGVRRMLDGR